MPRAFDRRISPVDKNPLVSGTDWNNPMGAIADAAALYGDQIREFIFEWVYSLFEDCVAFVEGLKDLGEGGNPIAKLGTGVQAFLDDLLGLIGLQGTPSAIIEGLQDLVDTFWSLLSPVAGTGKTLADIVSQFDDWLGTLPLIGPIVLAITGQAGDINDLTDFFENFPTAQAVINALTGGTTGTIADLIDWKNNLPLAQTVIDALLGGTNNSVAALQNWADGLLFNGDLLDSAGKLLTTVLPTITTSMISGLLSGGKLAIGLLPTITTSMVSGLLDTGGKLLTTLLPQLTVSMIQGLLDSTGKLLTGLLPTITTSMIQGLLDGGKLALSLLPTITTSMVTGLLEAGKLAIGLLPTITTSMVSGLLEAGKLAVGLLPTITTSMVSGLLEAGKLAVGLLPTITTDMVSGLLSAGKLAVGLLPTITASMISGLLAGDGKILTTLIPNLSAGLITSGQFLMSRVEGLAAEFLKHPQTAALVQAITGFSGQTSLEPITTFFSGFTPGGSLLSQLTTTLTGQDMNLPTLRTWFADQVVQVSTLVNAVTNGLGSTWTDLAAWAGNVLTTELPIAVSQLVGQISDAVLGVVPISHIGEPAQYPNLLASSAFADATTIEQVDGWSWDSSQNYPGSQGGSARTTAAAVTRTLFANQVIPVAKNNKLAFSLQYKTSGYAGSSTAIQYTIVPFGVPVSTPSATPVQLSPIVLASAGAAANWAALGTSSWTVPETYLVSGVSYRITSIRVRLLVTSAATAGTIWFDEVAVRKTGLLEQAMMADLVGAWNGLYEGLKGTPLNMTSATSADMKAAGDSVRTVTNDNALAITTNNTRVSTNFRNAVTGLLGTVAGDVVDSLIYDANYATSNNVAKLKGLIAALDAQQAAVGIRPGKQLIADFGTYSNGALTLARGTPPQTSPWQVTYFTPSGGTSSGTVEVVSGRAVFKPSGASRRRGYAINIGALSGGVYQNSLATDYQRVSAVLATQLNNASSGQTVTAAYLYARATSTVSLTDGHPENCVFAKFYVGLNGIIPTAAVELWYRTNVGLTRVANTSGASTTFFPWRAGATYTLEVGTKTNVRTCRIYQDSTVLAEFTATGSLIGADFTDPASRRFTGFGLEASEFLTVPFMPPEVAAWAALDNQPATTLGSGMRIARVSSTATSTLVATTASGAVLPAGVFTNNNVPTAPVKTDDITWASANLSATVTTAGWYLVEVRYELSTLVPVGAVGGNTFAAAVYVNGALYAVGPEAWGTANSTFCSNAGSHFIVYLERGHYVQPAYVSTVNTALIGDTTGTQTYFSMTFIGNSTPRNPIIT